MTEEITSVGIDIGTSTTSIVFSTITVINTSGIAKVPNFRIEGKEVIYRSPIYFTPLVSNSRLDTEKILEIVKKEYEAAGMTTDKVDTGAVIITGDTARKENAEEVLRGIAHYAGEFVVATAGPELESILAGKGSGADQISRKNFTTVANLDLGGGTTNIAVFKDGDPIDVACFDIGGRLIRFKEGSLTVDYAFRKMSQLGEILGFPIEVGVTLTKEQVDRICQHMAEGIGEILAENWQGEKYKFYLTQDSDFSTQPHMKQVTFSGGVGELIYNPNLTNDFIYNDLGVVLARKIQQIAEKIGVEVVKPSETIGATVVGAGTHTTEVSGSTITITHPEILPIQNIPVLKLTKEEEQEIPAAVSKKLGWLDWASTGDLVALAMDGQEDISFDQVQQVARDIIVAMAPVMKRTNTLIVVLNRDFAKVLGQSIRAQLQNDTRLLILDSVETAEGDYIDLGHPLGMGSVLPVIVKTILFNY